MKLAGWGDWLLIAFIWFFLLGIAVPSCQLHLKAKIDIHQEEETDGWKPSDWERDY